MSTEWKEDATVKLNIFFFCCCQDERMVIISNLGAYALQACSRMIPTRRRNYRNSKEWLRQPSLCMTCLTICGSPISIMFMTTIVGNPPYLSITAEFSQIHCLMPFLAFAESMSCNMNITALHRRIYLLGSLFSLKRSRYKQPKSESQKYNNFFFYSKDR